MNNEPVAIRYDFDGYGYQYMDSGSGSDWQTRVEGEFLYTHPAKTLTDEEIMNIFNNWTNNKQEHNLPANNQNYFYQEMREFARAILRKAQSD